MSVRRCRIDWLVWWVDSRECERRIREKMGLKWPNGRVYARWALYRGLYRTRSVCKSKVVIDIKDCATRFPKIVCFDFPMCNS